MSALSTRLVRLLNMVPYFQANPGSPAPRPPPSWVSPPSSWRRTSTSCGCAAFRAIPR